METFKVTAESLARNAGAVRRGALARFDEQLAAGIRFVDPRTEADLVVARDIVAALLVGVGVVTVSPDGRRGVVYDGRPQPNVTR